jgi:SAM-dependent methyltransferase
MKSIAKILDSIRTRGVPATLRAVYRRIRPRPVPPHPFDLAHGTDTGGLIQTRSGEHAHADHGTAYWGTAPSLLYGSLALWSRTLAPLGLTPADYSFVDLGCGKGRAVMLASETSFAHVLGVELDPALARIGQSNLQLWSRTPHPCRNIQIIEGDALTTPIPDIPVLLYLYNPFDAHLVQLLIARIESFLPTRTAPLDILYIRPDHAAFFEAIPGIQTVYKQDVPYTSEETAADIFDTTQQECFLYRLLPLNPTDSQSDEWEHLSS